MSVEMQELIKKLNRRYTMSMFVTNAMMYDTMNDERKEAAYLIESQAAEIAELDALRNDAVLRLDTYKALCDQMGKALKTLWLAAPTDVECNNMSHPKQKQHRYDETCPLVGEYIKAITGAGKALEAWRAIK